MIPSGTHSEHPIAEHLCERGRKQVPVAGAYTIRAATADVFRRPIVAYKAISVQAK